MVVSLRRPDEPGAGDWRRLMKRMDGLQKALYLIMAVLGLYILYKAGHIFLESRGAQQAMDSGEVQRRLEDAAMRTYAPGYTAAVEEKDGPDWMAGWMKELVPVYSYLADGQASVDGETGEEPGETGKKPGETDLSGAASSTERSGEEPGEKSGEKPGETDFPGAASSAETSREGSGEKSGETDPPGAASADSAGIPAVSRTLVSEETLRQLEDFDYLLANYYTVDEGTMADAALLDADVLLQKDLRLAQDASVPQILIYHTHSQEAFFDSEEGDPEDSIVGMGEVLAEELRTVYGYNVIHDTGVYDLVDGVLDRSASYDYAREAVQEILREHPTIEVIIDLHRDGVEGQKFVTEVDGQPASMIMFFNGISRDSQDQPLSWLQNPYTQENLAFSLQLQLAAERLYPGFTRNIYLKAERFNLHLRPRSLLIEAGTQLNTVEEEKNAMKPLARLLHLVLSGEQTD